MLKSVRVCAPLATENDRETSLLQFVCTVTCIHEKSREYVRAMYPTEVCTQVQLATACVLRSG